LHTLQWGQPSLVCDFQELYRYLVDDSVIRYCRSVKASDFVLKTDDYSINRKAKRQFLNEIKTRNLISELNRYFKTKVEIPRIRRGEKQEIETLISEEALLFAKYLRSEMDSWTPKIVSL
jgi:CRISPR/Cas system-associated endonuclease Cas1